MTSGTIRASAPLRISFVGGGTDFPHYYDLHGGAVLSATIDHAAHVSVAPRGDRQCGSVRWISVTSSSTASSAGRCTTA
jgi:galactokinase/mevalonate kinase-like predicted kinase